MLVIIILCVFFLNYCKCNNTRPDLDVYCKKSARNTPCLYRCEDNADCGKIQEYQPFTTKQKRLVLDLHNKFRDEIAAGEYAKEGIPAASNMQVLSYDKECEFIAACWMHQCVLDHDETRLTLENEPLGQNFYSISSKSDKLVVDEIVERAITTWFQEYKNIKEEHRDIFKSYQNKGIKINNFTAMVWEQTLYVGCAVLSHRRGSPMYATDFFCNYKPEGNKAGIPVYEEGEPLSKCKDGPNDKHPNLCGEIRIMAVDPFMSPIKYFVVEDAKDYNDPDYVEDDYEMKQFAMIFRILVIVVIILVATTLVIIIKCVIE